MRYLSCQRYLPLLAIAVASLLSAQTFEVASIKPGDPERNGRFITMPSANRFVAQNHTLKTLIAAAYNLSPKTVYGGPPWLDTDHFDILAKTPGEARSNLNQQMAMLRQLLTDRFGLTFHREKKDMPYYSLAAIKGAAALREGKDPPEGPKPLIFVLSPEGAQLPGRNATMGELASVLQRAAMDRPVVDNTGLTGRYDFDLEFSSDETLFGGALPAPAEPTRPDLFAALRQQLGLRLDSTKGPVDVLVIDKANRPTEN